MATNNAQIEKALKEAANAGERAAIRSLNNIAFKARKYLQERMYADLDRPTPFAKNSILYKKASMSQQNPIAKVYVNEVQYGKGDASEVLFPQVYGGSRRHTKFEQKLVVSGILPSHLYLAPGKDIPLNSFGNIAYGNYVKIGAALKVFTGRSAKLNSSDKSRERQKKFAESLFVVNQPSKLSMGIYQRHKGVLKQLIKFVKQPNYKARWKFHETAMRFFNDNYETDLNAELAHKGIKAGPSD